jgi:uncharacterized damage-inducible protein DinB
MAALPNPEIWMQGPIDRIPALLQPVAHTLLQAKEEIRYYLQDFPDELLWQRPANVASVGFHLQHIVGVLDRLTTYSAGEGLSEEQFDYLSKEGQTNPEFSTKMLVDSVGSKIDLTIQKLRLIDEDSLLQWRGVGRLQYPSTVIGLLFHAAEHTQRHSGQLLVTSRILLHKEGI